MDFDFKKFFRNLFTSRFTIMIIIFILPSLLLVKQLFNLQIVNGEKYQQSFMLRIEKTKSINAPRGNIYDRNGVLLAGNELSYNVTVEDSYRESRYKNLLLNSTLNEVIDIIEKNKDKLVDDYPIGIKNGKYYFKVEGTRLKRFKADIFGIQDVSDLSEMQLNVSADYLINYLSSASKYGIYANKFNKNDGENYVPEMYDADMLKAAKVDNYPDKFTKKRVLQLITLRSLISANYYQRYKAADIAVNVNEMTQTAILENKNSLQGVDINTTYRRYYNYSKLFSHIIGYTGKPSQDELYTLSSENEDANYTMSDTIGKAGIEKSMETVLRGKKGEEKIYVNNLGGILETADVIDPEAGPNIYLSIDYKLQNAAYKLLEKKLSNILYQRIENIRSYNPYSGAAQNIKIPITDVYFALINNNVIDVEEFNRKGASKTEKTVYNTFKNKRNYVLADMKKEIFNNGGNINSLNSVMKDSVKYMFTYMQKHEILKGDKIKGTEIYERYRDGRISVKELIDYAISNDLIDIHSITESETYLGSREIYGYLYDYLEKELKKDKGFSKLIYKKLIYDGEISGTQLSILLFDTGVLNYNESQYNGLITGRISAYNFIKSKIKSIELTPAMLGLDPCSGSVAIQDPKTGELLALVSYPGYDTNKMANGVDAKYYAKLTTDLSESLYNHATQQMTAPGSTYKMISAIAGLETHTVSANDLINCRGVFTEITPHARCWKKSGHGNLNLEGGIKNSCDVYFYTLAYRMSFNGKGGYDSDIGLQKLGKYASMFGLGEKTGIEIPEAAGHISDEDAVRSAIGQGNNSFTTIELCRYVNTVANKGNCYNMTLLSKVVDNKGNVIKEYKPTVKRQLDIQPSTWTHVNNGMRKVVENYSRIFGKLDKSVKSAGKTGTAEYLKTRGNHVLYVGYAPYNDPEMSIAVRIPFGYTSSYAAELTRDIMAYYFKVNSLKALLNGAMN